MNINETRKKFHKLKNIFMNNNNILPQHNIFGPLIYIKLVKDNQIIHLFGDTNPFTLNNNMIEYFIKIFNDDIFKKYKYLLEISLDNIDSKNSSSFLQFTYDNIRNNNYINVHFMCSDIKSKIYNYNEIDQLLNTDYTMNDLYDKYNKFMEYLETYKDKDSDIYKYFLQDDNFETITLEIYKLIIEQNNKYILNIAEFENNFYLSTLFINDIFIINQLIKQDKDEYISYNNWISTLNIMYWLVKKYDFRIEYMVTSNGYVDTKYLNDSIANINYSNSIKYFSELDNILNINEDYDSNLII